MYDQVVLNRNRHPNGLHGVHRSILLSMSQGIPNLAWNRKASQPDLVRIGVGADVLFNLRLPSRVDVSDIFCSFLLGGGEGGVRGDRVGGGRFLLENPRMGGGVLPLPGIWGWGAIFFFGAEMLAKLLCDQKELQTD